MTATHTTSDRRFPLTYAKPFAEHLKRLLAPACERIEIAGSIRRLKPDVGDIELLAVPTTTFQATLFGTRPVTDSLDLLVRHLITKGILGYRQTATALRTYGSLNKLLIHRPSHIPVDLFTATIENWGMAMMVRTGPAEWNIRFMARLRALGLRGHAYGGITRPGPDGLEPTHHIGSDCPDEETVFRYLGWPYTPPEARR